MEDYFEEMKQNFNFKQDKPLNEIIYEGLRKTIVLGLIPAGTRLNEKRLAEELSISRTPMREAIHRLQYEELLDYIPKVGSVVSQVSASDVAEVYQIRLALEHLAHTSAMDNLTPEDYKNLNQLLDQTSQSIKEQNLTKVVEQSEDFNQAIYRAAKMPRLSHLLTSLRDYVHRFRAISMSHEARGPLAVEEHRAILKAMEAKDEEAIKLVLEEHLGRSRDTIIDFLTNHNDKEANEILTKLIYESSQRQKDNAKSEAKKKDSKEKN